MKKKVLLSSIATIALCLCLIAGSTFALFTDSSDFNIAVTSGNVEIYSTATVEAIYSAEGPVAAHNDKYLKDENGAYYEHVERYGTFYNGGTAVVDQTTGEVIISKLTPGDKVDIRIHTENKGDVAFRYRYTIKVVTENGLETGMVLTTHSGEEYEAVKSFTSEWFGMVGANDTTTDLSKLISLELPVYAGNEYQSETEDQPEDNRLAGEKGVTYQILVEAVQANAVTTENETFVELLTPPTQDQVQLALNNEGTINLNGQTIMLEETLTAAGKDVSITNAVIDATNAEPFGDPQLALYLQNSNLTLEEGATIIAGEDYAVFGEGINEVTLKKGSKIVVPQGSNAVAMYLFVLDDTFTLTFEDSGLIEGNTTIILSTAGTYNFYVPDNAAYAEYSAMIVTDGTAQNINWMYLDGTPVNP